MLFRSIIPNQDLSKCFSSLAYKPKQWNVLTCYYKPHAYLGKARLGKQQMPYSFWTPVNSRIRKLNQVTSGGMEELEQRFKTADIVGKLANIGDDISNGYIAENSKFKKLVTGEPLMVERKGVDPFKIRNYGKLIFSANEVPRVNDLSDGLARRLVDRKSVV